MRSTIEACSNFWPKAFSVGRFSPPRESYTSIDTVDIYRHDKVFCDIFPAETVGLAIGSALLFFFPSLELVFGRGGRSPQKRRNGRK